MQDEVLVDVQNVSKRFCKDLKGLSAMGLWIQSVLFVEETWMQPFCVKTNSGGERYFFSIAQRGMPRIDRAQRRRQINAFEDAKRLDKARSWGNHYEGANWCTNRTGRGF